MCKFIMLAYGEKLFFSFTSLIYLILQPVVTLLSKKRSVIIIISKEFLKSCITRTQFSKLEVTIHTAPQKQLSVSYATISFTSLALV